MSLLTYRVKTLSTHSSAGKIHSEKTSLSKKESNASDDSQYGYLNHPQQGVSPIQDWLKYHRLHKYSSVIMTMTQDELLNQTEESLIALGVTKEKSQKRPKSN